jgi:hypothetical protein
MKRRDFITLLGAVAAWPLAARAQQGERMRRIGVLTAGTDANDPDVQARNAVLMQALQQLGWAEGATCGSIIDGARACPTPFASTRRNWQRSRRTSF